MASGPAWGRPRGWRSGPGLPLIGVGTLAATVLPVLAPGRLAVGVVAAGRGRLVSAVYRPASGPGSSVVPEEIGTPRNGSVAELGERLAGLAGPLTLAGELGDVELASVVAARPAGDLWVPPTPVRGRRPASVAAIGHGRWVRGEVDDADTLDAIYLHSAARPPGRSG